MARATKFRWLSVLLGVLLMISSMPMTAFAADPQEPVFPEQQPTQEWSIPITKVVEQTGEIAPGKEQFRFELVTTGDDDEWVSLEWTMVNDAIDTNGVGTFEGSLVFQASAEQLVQQESFFVRERNDYAEGWTYSTDVWRVSPQLELDPDSAAAQVRWRIQKVTADSAPSASDSGLPATDNPEQMPDSSITFTNQFDMDERVIEFRIPVSKQVQRTGNEQPGSRQFAFELACLAPFGKLDDEGGICMDKNAFEQPAAQHITMVSNTVNTNGDGTFTGEIVFQMPLSAIVQGELEWGVLVREVKGADPAWVYSDEMWLAVPYVAPECSAVEPDNDQPVPVELRWMFYPVTYYEETGEVEFDPQSPEYKMVFKNVYDPWITVAVPLTKLVAQTGTQTPDRQTFAFEAYDFAADDTDINANNLEIDTNGKGTYHASIQLQLRTSRLDELSKGFYVREKAGSAEGWSYSAAVWFVQPVWSTDSVQHPQITGWAFYPVLNGEVGAEAEKEMTFTNTYQVNAVQEDPRPTPPETPSTGGARMSMWWVVLMALSGAGILVLSLRCGRKPAYRRRPK